MPLTRSQERLLRRISTRKGREAEGVVLLEGIRVLTTAWEHGAELLFAVGDDVWSRDPAMRPLIDRLGAAGVAFHQVARRSFDDLSATESPQGILAVAREPSTSLGRHTGQERVLILDGIQDPGNVGTLIRAAAALAVDRVLALDGTADPWSPKAVRASAGLVFRLPPCLVEWTRARAWLHDAGVPLLAAHPRGTDVRVWLRDRAMHPGGDGEAIGSETLDGWALALGNEGAGARPGVLDGASARLAIPLAAGVESMNVAAAGAVLLWALGPGRQGPPAVR